MIKINAFTFLIIILFILSGCDKKISSSKNSELEYVTYNKTIKIKNEKESLLIKRFLEYWDARVKNNSELTWRYELPYQKYLIDFKDYKNLLSGYKNTKISLNKILKLTNQEAILERYTTGNNKTITKKDKWIYIKNNWYHKFYQSILPPKDMEEAEFQ